MQDIHEAKTHFYRLVERVMRGEEVVVGKAGKPVARLVPYREDRGTRVPGGWKGLVRIADDFEELPDELAAAFRGEHP